MRKFVIIGNSNFRSLLLAFFLVVLNYGYANVSELEKKAADGDAGTLTELGKLYFEGKETTPDYAKAFQYFHEAAMAENAEAMYYLGMFFEEGYGVPVDYEKAVQYYKMAMDWDLPEAYNAMGLCYDKGIGVKKDVKQAAKLYREAVVRENEDAKFNLGILYYWGLGVSQDYGEAVYFLKDAMSSDSDEDNEDIKKLIKSCYDKVHEKYLKSAEEGDAEAQYKLGEFYNFAEMDRENSFNWFYKSAVNGNPKAQLSVGTSYIWGYGVEIDYETGMKWIKKSAEQGYDDAQYVLAEFYSQHYTTGAEENPELEAFRWYSKAATQQNPNAMYNKALYYLKGRLLVKDIRKGLQLLEASAEKGCEDAIYLCATLFYNGNEIFEGVDKDYHKAFYYLKKAWELPTDWDLEGNNSNKGYVAKLLSSSYRFGRGVKRDEEKADYYIMRSARYDEPDALQILDILLKMN